ncbi:MAG: hypothetical protein JSV31_24170 [Desulfobacterales bacterium]|nr:MAG: hypothetical protein JSV31_24170 [Desulfobacterales bacterium]
MAKAFIGNRWQAATAGKKARMKPITAIDRKQGHHLKILDCKTAYSILTVIGILLMHATVVTHSASASESLINCDAHRGACSQSLGDLTVSLEITPRPVKAMQDLVFKVTFSGQPPSKIPYIDLGMPGMKMGPNRVLLRRTEKGYYEGKGVIVRCPSGRRTWFADVTIPGSGEVKFIFDVIY